MSQKSASEPTPIPDPSATLPVDLRATELLARARDDALAKALLGDEAKDSWQPTPAPRPPRAWDAASGTWTEAEDVPDPSWVDADDLPAEDDPTADFGFPEWASDDSLVTDPVRMPPARRPPPTPASRAPRYAASAALALLGALMVGWLFLG